MPKDKFNIKGLEFEFKDPAAPEDKLHIQVPRVPMGVLLNSYNSDCEYNLIELFLKLFTLNLELLVNFQDMPEPMQDAIRSDYCGIWLKRLDGKKSLKFQTLYKMLDEIERVRQRWELVHIALKEKPFYDALKEAKTHEVRVGQKRDEEARKNFPTYVESGNPNYEYILVPKTSNTTFTCIHTQDRDWVYYMSLEFLIKLIFQADPKGKLTDWLTELRSIGYPTAEAAYGDITERDAKYTSKYRKLHQKLISEFKLIVGV